MTTDETPKPSRRIPRKPRKHNPDWKDTPEKKAERQRTRYDDQTQIAKQMGYTSWAALVTAILKGEVKLVKNSSNIVG